MRAVLRCLKELKVVLTKKSMWLCSDLLLWGSPVVDSLSYMGPSVPCSRWGLPPEPPTATRVSAAYVPDLQARDGYDSILISLDTIGSALDTIGSNQLHGTVGPM